MLWYKSWLETQHWFFLGMMLLAAQVVALYVAYPMDPLTTYPNGALGVLPVEMAQLRTGDFRGVRLGSLVQHDDAAVLAGVRHRACWNRVRGRWRQGVPALAARHAAGGSR